MSAYYKRALSLREADRCENAREPKCVCRCGGTAHGKARILPGETIVNPTSDDADNPLRKAYQALPKDDPHHLPTKEEAWAIARDRATHRRYHNQPWLYTFNEWDFKQLKYDPRPCEPCEAEGRPTREEWNALHPTPVDA